MNLDFFCWVISGEGHGCIIWVHFFFSWGGGREGEVDVCFFGLLVSFCLGFLVFGEGEGGAKTSEDFGVFFVFRTHRWKMDFLGGIEDLAAELGTDFMTQETSGEFWLEVDIWWPAIHANFSEENTYPEHRSFWGIIFLIHGCFRR